MKRTLCIKQEEEDEERERGEIIMEVTDAARAFSDEMADDERTVLQ